MSIHYILYLRTSDLRSTHESGNGCSVNNNTTSALCHVKSSDLGALDYGCGVDIDHALIEV